MVEHEVKHTIAKLSEWMAPETVPTPAWLAPATSEVRRDPYGVVLIIAPFNYPLQVRVGGGTPLSALDTSSDCFRRRRCCLYTPDLDDGCFRVRDSRSVDSWPCVRW